MKNISLYIPELEDYWYQKKIQSDPLTMNYNAAYDVNYQYNKTYNRYECGILIESKYRGKGYSKAALNLLCIKQKKIE